MGGNAFEGLTLPRLSPSDYAALLSQATEILSLFFNVVTLAPEAPEKLDYGDVDILVSEPKKPESLSGPRSSNVDSRSTFQLPPNVSPLHVVIGKDLKAIRILNTGVTKSFCVPHPSVPGAFSQVDIHECAPGHVAWEAWMGGYGDLLQILGTLSRRLGLTMNDRGLHVRIEEIEKKDRKKSMVRLTSDPSEVCEFLGLDWKKWESGFDTKDELFRWIAKGRWYGYNHFVDGQTDGDQHNVQADITSNGIETANDRARLRKRAMYAGFMTEWIFENKEAFGKEFPSPRNEVLGAALDRFNSWDDYNHKMEEWQKEHKLEGILSNLRQAIPLESTKQRLALRGLRKWAAFENGEVIMKDTEDASDPSNLDWLLKLDETSLHRLTEWLQKNYATLKSQESRVSKHRDQ